VKTTIKSASTLVAEKNKRKQASYRLHKVTTIT